MLVHNQTFDGIIALRQFTDTTIICNMSAAVYSVLCTITAATTVYCPLLITSNASQEEICCSCYRNKCSIHAYKHNDYWILHNDIVIMGNRDDVKQVQTTRFIIINNYFAQDCPPI